jgi:hypothetical protein
VICVECLFLLICLFVTLRGERGWGGVGYSYLLYPLILTVSRERMDPVVFVFANHSNIMLLSINKLLLLPTCQEILVVA